MIKKTSLISCLTLGLVGCASTPTPQYVSPNNYQTYDCQQLTTEYHRLSQYINHHNKNKGFRATGVGIGISAERGGIYPSISVGMGSVGGNQNNLAIAMGEHDAVIQTSRLKQCQFANNIQLFTEK